MPGEFVTVGGRIRQRGCQPAELGWGTEHFRATAASAASDERS
jgi:hypothetical protein